MKRRVMKCVTQEISTMTVFKQMVSNVHKKEAFCSQKGKKKRYVGTFLNANTAIQLLFSVQFGEDIFTSKTNQLFFKSYRQHQM